MKLQLPGATINATVEDFPCRQRPRTAVVGKTVKSPDSAWSGGVGDTCAEQVQKEQGQIFNGSAPSRSHRDTASSAAPNGWAPGGIGAATPCTLSAEE